jgi:hypothetical protein
MNGHVYLDQQGQIKLLAFATVVIYFIIQLGMKSFFSDTAGGDVGTVERLAESGDFGGGAYGMTALIYSIFPEYLKMPVVYISGVLFILFCFSKIHNAKYAILMSFLCFSPIMMAIGTFQKDLILVWFTLPMSILIFRSTSIRACFLVLAFFYITYAIIFRIYFLIIFFGVVYLYLLFVLPVYVKTIMLTALFVVFLLVPVELLYDLQAPRDVANIKRIYSHGRDGARTAFMNPFEINGIVSFMKNYLYSYWKMDLSVFVSLSIKEIYLFLNLVCYYSIAFWAVFSNCRKCKMLGFVILSHILVLHLFEPDSGSYLRHLSSTLPYVALLFYFRHDQALKKTKNDFEGVFE